MLTILILFCISLFCNMTFCDTSSSAIDLACAESSSCSTCMAQHPECHWCMDESFKDKQFGRRYRCASKSTLIKRGCPPNMIDTSTTRIEAPTVNNAQQLNPQRQTVHIRPHTSLTINLTYTQKEYHPVDLYYLTDISFSMKDDLQTMSKLAVEISHEMRRLTKAFRMGFGAFVDKPLFPFVAPNLVKNPCQDTGPAGDNVCEPPYVYQHFLDLTEDIPAFQRVTNQADKKASGNIDAPEAGLDALMQVALCDRFVGWNRAARKIVLLATDGSFHVAGDGRLAGLVRPSPQTCMLRDDVDRFDPNLRYLGYHDAIFYDYPSVGELARVLEEADISVIFAVIGNYTQLYSRLAEMLPVAKVGQVSEASSNIVELIRENYKSIVTTVELAFNSPHDDINLQVETRCHGEDSFQLKSKCDNHPLGKQIEYRVLVTPTRCQPTPRTLHFTIKGVDEKSQIELITACDCPTCNATPPPANQLSPQCSQSGSFYCGVCRCDSQRFGEFCECSSQDAVTEEQLLADCRKDSASSVLCSGHGRCECGTCRCENPERFTGQFCECDRDACPRAADDNSVCGGEARGVCECNGTCSCQGDYTGPSCDCLLDNSRCFDQDNVSCSNNGDCDCGMCMCHSGYTGLKCNEKITVKNEGRCTDDSLRQCVRCLQSNAAVIHQDESQWKIMCYNACSLVQNVLIQSVKIVEEDPQTNINQITCVSVDDNGCRLTFFYRYTTIVIKERGIDLWVQKELHCPPIVSVLLIILAVILGVVIIGIVIILVWKLVVTIDDQREMAQFIKEQDNAKWEMEENPIFTEPVTMVKNPMYGGDL